MKRSLPSEQNFTIYHEVTFGGYSLREAAAMFQISATRIAEICQQIEDWYEQSTPEWARDYDPELKALAAWRMTLVGLDWGD